MSKNLETLKYPPSFSCYPSRVLVDSLSVSSVDPAAPQICISPGSEDPGRKSGHTNSKWHSIFLYRYRFYIEKWLKP